MSDELTHYNQGGGALRSLPSKDVLEHLTKQLNQRPSKDEVMVNKMANNALYLPIAAVEAKLDYIFNGLWKTDTYSQQVIANEVTGSILLHVFHPAGVWLTRVGTASVLIQQSKGADITDLGAKIKNTLVKDIPHLKAECIKNAAKSLGAAFGRDLNRAFDNELGVESTTDTIEAEMQALHTVDELNEYWKQLTRLQKQDLTVRNLYKLRKIEIQEGGQND